jgi:hypothetical protein
VAILCPFYESRSSRAGSKTCFLNELNMIILDHFCKKVSDKVNIIRKSTLLIASFLVISGCSKAAQIKNDENQMAYASYSDGEYTLYVVNPTNFESVSQLSLMEGYGTDIYQDANKRIWIPINWAADSTTSENHVIVIDPVTSKKTIIEVGSEPVGVIFLGETAYVVCNEDGFTPTIYKIDNSLHATKWKTVQGGGLISRVQSDGSNIYWSSLYVYPDKPADPGYPQIVRVSANGDVKIQRLAETNRGFNSLLYFNQHLYMGLQGDKSSLVELDPTTLKVTREFPYNKMVGSLTPINDHEIAVTNYSDRLAQGSQISLMDLKSDKNDETFNTKILPEHVSFLDGKYYVVDNHHNKIEVLDRSGREEEIFNAPTMVSNIMKVN